jgi:Fe-S cluster assembly iron-binding protein IscA
VKRFHELVNTALIPKQKRKITRTPKAVGRKRLVKKKQTSEKKTLRKKVKLSGNQGFDLS